MSRTQRALTLLLAFALLLGCSANANADNSKPGEQAGDTDQKIKVAILTGQNNHAWMIDTPVLKNILDDAEMFDTTLLITPDRASKTKAEEWKTFKPTFADFDVIVINYNGDMWPDNIKKAWVDYISGGGKAYSFHAGNNPFRGWTEYEQMIGMLWRGAKGGNWLYFDDEGNQHIKPAGEDKGAGHGRQHDYLVDTRDNDHPVFKGLPDKWMHGKDELYHRQRGPAENMTVLLTAYSDPKTGGTGVHEPIVWTIPFGKGTVMTNVKGHWWKGQKEGPALACAGFQTIFTRSIEWLATGKVTTEKPGDFPTEEQVSLRELKPYEPLAHIHIPGVPGNDAHANCGCDANPYLIERRTAASIDAAVEQNP